MNLTIRMSTETPLPDTTKIPHAMLHEYEHEANLPNIGHVLIGFDIKETGLVVNDELHEHPTFRLRGVWPANIDGTYSDDVAPNLTPDDAANVDAAMYAYCARHGYHNPMFFHKAD